MHMGFWWGNLKERDPLGTPMCQWEGNIKMECTVLGWESMAWFN
jgi:hypothetical protein